MTQRHGLDKKNKNDAQMWQTNRAAPALVEFEYDGRHEMLKPSSDSWRSFQASSLTGCSFVQSRRGEFANSIERNGSPHKHELEPSDAGYKKFAPANNHRTGCLNYS